MDLNTLMGTLEELLFAVGVSLFSTGGYYLFSCGELQACWWKSSLSYSVKVN